MVIFLRYPISILLAGSVTFALFLLMVSLIAMNSVEVERTPHYTFTDFVMPEKEPVLIENDDLLIKPPEPTELPPALVTPPLEVTAVTNITRLPPVDNGVEVNPGDPLIYGDGEYLPVVKVAPIYPNRAITRGIEGYVIVQFTVTTLGTVVDPVIVEAFDTNGNPTSVFNDSAMKAVVKFKYKPKMINGQAVAVSGVQNKLTYNLSGD